MEDDKYMSTVKIGPKGQIIIPKDVRDMFGLKPGDQLILMADEKRGIALQKADFLKALMNAVFSGDKEKIVPQSTDEEDKYFAQLLKNEMEKSDENDSSES